MTCRHQQPVEWLPVLMYHRVVDRVRGPDPYHLSISTADFESQMAFLNTRGYQAIRLDQVPLAASERSPWSKPVAITFDDGYRDTYTHAFPILQKHGHTATIMLVSERIGGQNTWDAGQAEPAPLLSLDEIHELQRHGMHFGAHGATHASLPNLSREQAREELASSKSRLEKLLGHAVTTLAYPYGRSTPEVCRIAEEVGFVAAFGVEHWNDALLDFSRIDAAACKGDTFLWRLKVSGAYRRLRNYSSMRLLNSVRKFILHEPARWRQQPTATNS